jgi:hypothetical protein
MDDSKSQIRNPKYQIGRLENNRTPLVRFDISDQCCPVEHFQKSDKLNLFNA